MSALVTLLLLGVNRRAQAAPSDAAAPARDPAPVTKPFEPHYFVGIKASYLTSIHTAETHGERHTVIEHHGGAGIFAEFTLVPHWLELEIGFRALSAPHGASLPFDVLLKIPFHVNRWFHPYVGLGAVMAIAVGEHDTAVHFGGAAAVGAYFWIHRHVALLVELNYNLLESHGLLHEVGGNTGVVFGF